MISKDSLERRILDILKIRYPITIDELKKELRVNPRIADRSLKKLAVMGYIEFDVLPDKTYIRLLVLET